MRPWRLGAERCIDGEPGSLAPMYSAPGHGRVALAVIALALCLLGSVPAAAQAAPRLKQIGSFLPVFVTAAAGDRHRLYVVERAGRVRLVKDGSTLSTPFLDISARVNSTGAGGLLSIAFPPITRRVVVSTYYTDAIGIRIAEFTRSASRDLANPASERILVTQPHSTDKDHYAGQLQFDSSGLLYVSVGDGGDGGGLAQDLTALWGKVLRIRPTAGAGVRDPK